MGFAWNFSVLKKPEWVRALSPVGRLVSLDQESLGDTPGPGGATTLGQAGHHPCADAAYRVGGEDVQVRFVSLQQQTQRAEEALHQQVDALTVTGQQQLLHRLHRNAHIPEEPECEVRHSRVCVCVAGIVYRPVTVTVQLSGQTFGQVRSDTIQFLRSGQGKERQLLHVGFD